jgi:peptidoglycan hydrolase CwlO-like protein
MKNMVKSDPLRTAAIIVTVISICVTIWIYVDSNHKKDLYAAELLKKTYELFNAENRIAEKEARIARYQKEIEDAYQIIEKANKKEDSLVRSAAIREGVIKQLKKQLDEKPVILDVDDNEQLRIFFQWSQPIR